MTQAHIHHSFQQFNWNGILGPLGIGADSSLTTTRANNGDQDQVVTLIGRTYRVCPESQKPALLWALADIFSPAAPTQTRQHSQDILNPETPLSGPSSLVHPETMQNNDHAVALHRYTSMLHDRSQREKKIFQRIEEEAITIEPPLFRVTVQYGDVVCSREARTKKEAAHLAAKAICGQLNEDF